MIPTGRTRRAGGLTPGSRPPSKVVGADDLAPGPRGQRPPGYPADRLPDEADAAVAEQDIGPPGVEAVGGVEHRVADVAVAARAPGVQRESRRRDGVEQREA